MKAIILAAGIGYRLLPLTNALPKALVKVSGKTFLEWIIEPLIKRGVRDIIIVVGYKQEMVKAFLLGKYRDKINAQFVENDIYDKTNNIYSLWLASSHLEDDDFLLFESDEVFEECILDKLINTSWENVAVVDKYKRGFDEGTVVLLNEENDVIDLLTKEDQLSNYRQVSEKHFYKTLNIYKFSKSFLRNHFVPYLDIYIKSQSWNKYYEVILKLIIALKQPKIKGLSVEGCKWAEVDILTDLGRAGFTFSPKKEQLEILQTAYGGFWNYAFEDFNLTGNDYFPVDTIFADVKYMLNKLMKEFSSRQDILDAKLANVLRINSENVVCLNGSSQGIKIIMDKFKIKYLLPVPAFNEYLRLAEKPSFYKFNLKSLSWHIEDILRLTKTKEAEGLVIINPHNPTSAYLNKSVLTAVLKELAFLKLIIIDESFIDFSGEEGLSEDIHKFNNLLIIKSLGKSMGIFGLRIGAAISANRDFLKIIKDSLPIWNINSLAEYFLEIFPRHRKEYEDSLRKVKAARERLYKDILDCRFLRVVKPNSNFIFFELRKNSPLDADEFTYRLYRDFNILVKNCTDKIKQFFDYQGKGFIRVAIRTEEKNQKLLFSLENLLK